VESLSRISFCWRKRRSASLESFGFAWWVAAYKALLAVATLFSIFWNSVLIEPSAFALAVFSASDRFSARISLLN
jgi:hypothetical protein